MEFIELPTFEKKRMSRLDEESFGELCVELNSRPEHGTLIQHGGGLRKIRFAPTGRGKSGGVRVIYYWKTKAGEIYYFDIFAKNEKDNLSARELQDLRNILQ